MNFLCIFQKSIAACSTGIPSIWYSYH